MAALYDRNGNALDIGGNAKASSILNGADVFIFADSNGYYSYGHDLTDIGSIYQRLSLEFSIKSWTNKGKSGYTTWQPEYTGNALNTVNATEAVHGIAEIIAEKFPKVQYHWIIPPETDWSKWTGSTEADGRNMAEKMPYIIQRLEECQFPYCDMYHTSGITSEMLPDGIHLGGGGEDYTTDAVYKYYRRLREYLMNK